MSCSYCLAASKLGESALGWGEKISERMALGSLGGRRGEGEDGDESVCRSSARCN